MTFSYLYEALSYQVTQIYLLAFSSLDFLLFALPFLLFLELPLTLLTLLGVFRWSLRNHRPSSEMASGPTPAVSCIVTCYSEGRDIEQTVLTLCEQQYKGRIEILLVVDGATQNRDTYQAALSMRKVVASYANRELTILPKWQRGGRVSSCNAGLAYAKGEIVMALDGDTSFDNDMVSEMAKAFEDPNVPAVAGCLRVRNYRDSFATRMQAVEYLLSIQLGKTGLSEWNLVNNISGAFGAFRTRFLRQIGGWDTHTAEDLDLTIRIKSYFKRHPGMRIPFLPRAMGHTDAPNSFGILAKQRMRWEGDLLFIFFRKHRHSLTPALLGWPTFLFTILSGVFHGILMPIVICGFLIWLLAANSVMAALSLLIAIYLFYMAQLVLMFGLLLLFVSERPKQDLKLAMYLPFYPIYGVMLRFVSVVALADELFRRAHEETTMAPWWVLKKGKKF